MRAADLFVGGNRALAWVALLLTLAGSAGQSVAGRVELDLSGSWQYQKVSQLSFPPSNNWQTVAVPGFLSGWQYEHAWFRCVFTPPASMAGARLKLRFGGAKYNSQVWVNSAFIGSYLNGYEPFEFDVTAAAKVGQTNELLVGVTDWTSTFSAPVDFTKLPANEDPRYYAQNVVLAPIGGRYELYGLWQPVRLVSAPPVAIAEVFVMPSVRAQQLTVRLTLRNDTTNAQIVNVANRALDGGLAAITLPARQVTVPPGSLSVDVSTAWTNAHWWSHLDPYLYSLETTLTSGANLDQVQTRFGFRECWTEKGQFLLNGIPITLLASATWPPTTLQSSNAIAQVLLEVKAANAVAMRMHTQPWDESWYDIADQIGLLIVEECAVWCDPKAYRLGDSAFWTNYSQHVAAAAKRDRNHPSIVLWSLENEILHCGGEQLYNATDTQLAAMGRVLKAIDPTRPITYEADLDPGGEADVLGLHYPHEFPDYQLWPNAAWWMGQPIARSWVPGGQWQWDRAKPLYIGEFLYVPPTAAAQFSILFGDDAYADPTGYRNLAKGLTWRMQIEAYRAYGVNGVSPWTLFEDPAVTTAPFDLNPSTNHLYQVQKTAYDPNYVFVEEYNPRFFTGDTVTRTAHLFNDRPDTNQLTLKWSAGGAWQSQSLTLPPAGRWQGTISFPAPSTVGPFNLQLEVVNGATVVFTNSYSYAALARPTLELPVGTRLGLYDPFGATSNLLGGFDIPFTRIADLRTASYSQMNLLIIGRCALTNEPAPEVGKGSLAAQLGDFASLGGWIIVLEQTNYPSWMPLQLQNFDATFAFPSADHPAMRGLTSDDLRWWAGDHRVVAQALAAPSRGNFRILSTIGSTSGLEYAAAVEAPVGKGGFLCSQFLLAQKFASEPLAGPLLQRLLDYCAPGVSHPGYHAAGLVTETNSAAAAALAGIGLEAENLSGRLTNCDPTLYPVMILAGSNAVWQEATLQLSNLTSYVEGGGKLVLHRPTSSFLAAAQPTLFPDLDWANIPLGRVLRRDDTNAAVRFANHDLYWIAQAATWDQSEVLSTNVARRTYRRRFDLANFNTIQVASMPTRSTGAAAAGGWWLYNNGYVAQDITIAEPGTYLFNISASGTPAFGGWPQMSLRIDGQVRDSILVPTNALGFYTLSADLTSGVHQLSISFDNDTWNPPTEDRNLFLAQIRWGRESDDSSITLLTQPAAVAQSRLGRGLVVLDEMMWETETQNAVKAARYVSSLLTGLGAAMTQPMSLAIPAASMTNVDVAAYSIDGNSVWLNSNGRIQSRVSFSSAGYYTFTLLAGGTAALGVLPQVAVVVDGINQTNFFLVSASMTQYAVTLRMTAGAHAIGLAFLNDYYANGEDRNAAFGLLTITAQAAPQITALEVDAPHQTATLQWQATPGKRYEVQTLSDFSGGPWYAVANFLCNDNIATWRDTGAGSNAPPLTDEAPRRYYRIRQVGP